MHGAPDHVCTLSCCKLWHLAKLQPACASRFAHMGELGPKLSLSAIQGQYIPMQGHLMLTAAVQGHAGG